MRAIEIGSDGNGRTDRHVMTQTNPRRIEADLIGFLITRVFEHDQAGVQIKECDPSGEGECGAGESQDRHFLCFPAPEPIGLKTNCNQSPTAQVRG